MQSASAGFFKALRSGQWQMATRVDAVRDGVVVASDLELASGVAHVDSTRATRAQLDCVLPDRSVESVLVQPGTELAVSTGVRFHGGTELVPVGVFPVGTWNLAYAPSGGIKVSCPDRWAVVQRARFPIPVQWNGQWASSSDAVGALMRGPWTDRQAANPDTVAPLFLNQLPGLGSPQPGTVWKQDRAKAITDMVTAVGGEAFFDEQGNAVLRPLPVLAAAGVWDADAGERGVLMDATRSRSWEDVYNAVVVNGVATGDEDASTVARGMVQINDSSHPLWTSGPFGMAPFFYSSSAVATDEQALATAAALLGAAASLNATISAVCAPNPALQCGDTIAVKLPTGETELHVLQAYPIPLTPGDAGQGQTLTLRSSKTGLPEQATG